MQQDFKAEDEWTSARQWRIQWEAIAP